MAGGTITFDNDFTLPASGTVNYVLSADLGNLVANDSITVSLGTANVTLAAGALGGTAPTTVVHTANPPSVSSSADDSWTPQSTDDASGNVNATTALVSDWMSGRRHAGFRIPGVYIPKGASINSATISVYLDASTSVGFSVCASLETNAQDFALNGQLSGALRPVASRPRFR